MRKLNIVLGIIQQREQYIFQLRNGDPKIGAAGKLGSFGGKIEADEAALSAVVREISEETTLKTTPEMWKLLGQVEVISDHKLEDVQVYGTVFMCDAKQENIKAKEGELVTLTRDQILENLDNFTTGTRAAFEKFILIKERV